MVTAMHTPESLHAQLTQLGLPFTTHHHKALFTVADGADTELYALPGAHIKNLFVKDKAGKLFLITALQTRSLNLVTLGKHLGAKDRLSFANEETLLNILGITPGSVSPLALINAAPGSLRFVLDAEVPTHATVYPHPLTNTQTTAMAPSDMLKAITHWGHVPEVLDLTPFPRS